jgi:glucose/arabinose dehydrogenase
MRQYRAPVISSLSCLSLRMGLLLLLFCGCGGGGGGSDGATPAPPPSQPIVLSGFVAGFTAPIGLEAPDDGTGRLFVIEQGGTIRIIQNASVLPTPFLDVTTLVESGGEKGLLGLTFHPNFNTTRRFFVHYTRRVGTQLQSVISEFSASNINPNQADVASERPLLIVNQPFDTHNGGQLAFGHDGFLYVALGDGGDNGANGQDLQVLLGKILRIDVDGSFAPGKQYAIPADNPFAAGAGFPRSGRMGFAIPGGFHSTVARGASLPEMSAQAVLRKWT